MPIPPRPSHNQHNHNRRPARSSTTRKVIFSQLNNLQAIQSSQSDWRAEVALLSELGSKSFPLSGTGGGGRMQIVEFKHLSPATSAQGKVEGSATNEGRTEVNLEGLIAQSRGKREKRATTATTLGFDFITTPAVLALPDTALDASASASPSASASAVSSKSQIGKATPTATATLKSASESPALSLAGTPTTPALLAQHASDVEEEEEEEDDDDWEHVHIPSAPSAGLTKVEEDEDVIVLGELDLDELTIDNDHGIGGGKGERTSYAAALGIGAARAK